MRPVRGQTANNCRAWLTLFQLFSHYFGQELEDQALTH